MTSTIPPSNASNQVDSSAEEASVSDITVVDSRKSFGRREFLGIGLLAGAAAVGGGLVVRASGGTAATPGAASELVGIPATFDHLAGLRQRVAFGIGRNNDVLGPNVEVRVRASASTVSFDGPYVRAVGVAGDDRLGVRPYYVAELELPASSDLEVPDTVALDIDFGGDRVVTYIDAVSTQRASFPVPGTAMRPVVTPTATDTLGADPICTRTPTCGLHGSSFSDVVGKDRPTILYLGTPALCQSRFCGPTLDSILTVVPEFPQVDFVHCEVFTDLTGTTYIPAVGVLGVRGEPVMFTVDADGNVRSFLSGPWGVDDTRAAIRTAL